MTEYQAGIDTVATRPLRKLAFAGVCAAALFAVTVPAMAQQQSASSLNAREQSAFDVRFVQTEFMVAALSCGRPEFHQLYNSFVARFSGALKRHGDVLKAHFSREYGKQGAARLDSFATKLANEASLRSMRQVTFCQDTGMVMERVAQLDLGSFDSFSSSFARSVETVAAIDAQRR